MNFWLLLSFLNLISTSPKYYWSCSTKFLQNVVLFWLNRENVYQIKDLSQVIPNSQASHLAGFSVHDSDLKWIRLFLLFCFIFILFKFVVVSNIFDAKNSHKTEKIWLGMESKYCLWKVSQYCLSRIPLSFLNFLVLLRFSYSQDRL